MYYVIIVTNVYMVGLWFCCLNYQACLEAPDAEPIVLSAGVFIRKAAAALMHRPLRNLVLLSSLS